MKNLLIGIVIGMLVATPLVWAAAHYQLTDSDGDGLSISSDGAVSITF